jgi:hypothetical protein
MIRRCMQDDRRSFGMTEAAGGMTGAAGDNFGAAGWSTIAAGRMTGAAGGMTGAAGGMTAAAGGKIGAAGRKGGAACSCQLAGRLAKLFRKSGVLSYLLYLLLSDVEMSVLLAPLFPLLPSTSR